MAQKEMAKPCQSLRRRPKKQEKKKTNVKRLYSLRSDLTRTERATCALLGSRVASTCQDSTSQPRRKSKPIFDPDINGRTKFGRNSKVALKNALPGKGRLQISVRLANVINSGRRGSIISRDASRGTRRCSNLTRVSSQVLTCRGGSPSRRIDWTGDYHKRRRR